jgi:hypothetical protein
MQDHYWVLERQLNGIWYVVGAYGSRDRARDVRRRYSATAFRIRKFIAA